MQYEPSRETQSPPYIPQSPPAMPQYPPQNSGYLPTSPPAGYPPPQYPQVYGPPPPKKSFWSSAGGVFTILGLAVVGVMVLCGGLVAFGMMSDSAAAAKMDVKITSCEFTDGVLPAATVGYVITNNGDSANSVSLHIEYRNFRDEKVDDDVESTQDVAPGQTARGEVHTLLDVAVGNGGKCILTDVS